jgi:hypothetical protein
VPAISLFIFQVPKKIYFFNRRFTQTSADRIFSLLDLSKEKLHALRANSFINFIRLLLTVLIFNFEKANFIIAKRLTDFVQSGLPRHSFSDGWSTGQKI